MTGFLEWRENVTRDDGPRCKVNMEIVEVSADQKCLHTDVGGITVQSILAHADYAGEGWPTAFSGRIKVHFISIGFHFQLMPQVQLL